MASIKLSRRAIDRALPSIESGLEKYRWIQASVVQRNVAIDAEFQRRFNGFYRVRGRDRKWLQAFFGLLEQCKRVPLSFEAVLETLHAKTGSVEASFASKLTATIDPSQPVIDSVVLGNVGLALPYPKAVDRMARVVHVHDELRSLYAAFLMTDVGRYLVDQFNARYADSGVTDVKKLDLVLWKTWRWQKGAVDRFSEYIELRYRDASHAGCDRGTPVALIGPPKGRVFRVQWLAEPEVPREVISQVRRELDFYLVEKHEPNPWGYAVAHCGTAANVYSGIHWIYFSSGQATDR